MAAKHDVDPALERGQRDARFNLRTSTQQQAIIRQAAAAVDKSVTDFVLESATTTAQRVLADRRWFLLSDEDWAEFTQLIDAPVNRTPKLTNLLSERTVFDEVHQTSS